MKSAVSSSSQTNSSTISATSIVIVPFTSLRSAVMKTGTFGWRSRSLRSNAADSSCAVLPCVPRCQLTSTARSDASEPTIASPSSNDNARTTSQLRAASAEAIASAERPIAVSGRASASSTVSTRGRMGPEAGVSIALPLLFLFLRYAIDHVPASAVRLRLEAQAVDVGLEAGELGVKLARVQQVVLDGLGLRRQALTRHDHRDARRIRNEHDGENPVHQLVDLHRLDLPVHQVVVSLGGPQRHFGQRRVHVLLRLRDVVVAVDLVDALAQVLQAHRVVDLRMRRGKRRHGALDRRVR